MTHIFFFSPKIREISCTKRPLICFPDHVMGSHRFRHHCQAFLLPALKPLCLCVELNLLQDQRVPGEALHCASHMPVSFLRALCDVQNFCLFICFP